MKVQLLLITLATILPLHPAVARTDPMCAPLREFIRSVQPDETKSFDFHTSWGSNIKDSVEPAIFAKRCNHYGYGPAKAVCKYFMEHAATEFSDNNLKRAVMCLSTKTRIDEDVSFGSTAISLTYGTDDRGSHVNLEFAGDPEIGGMVLKVAADGY